MLDRAKELYHQQKYVDARLMLEKVVTSQTISQEELGEAYLYLGNIYYFGRGVEKSLKSSTEYYDLGAKAGHIKCQVYAGHAYQFGDGVEIDLEKARNLYLSAARARNRSALFQLGYMAFCGKGLPEPDHLVSVYWLRQAASVGSPEAFYIMGEIARRYLDILAETPEGLYWKGLALNAPQQVERLHVSDAEMISHNKDVVKQSETTPSSADKIDPDLFNCSPDVRTVLSAVLRSRDKPALFYLAGNPFCGKRSFARYILAELSKPYLEKNELSSAADDDRDAVNLLLDWIKEAEEHQSGLIITKFSQLFSHRIREDQGQFDPALIEPSASILIQAGVFNSCLSQARVPIFLIDDKSMKYTEELFKDIKHFYQVKFNPPSGAQLERFTKILFNKGNPWNNSYSKWELDLLERVVGFNYQVIKSIKDRFHAIGRPYPTQKEIYGEIEKINLERAKTGITQLSGEPASREVEFSYDLIHCNIDLRQLTEKLGRVKSKAFAMLIYGPAGTGKSHYLRHLASQLKLPLLEKRGSDLLGRYWGDNEKGIAEAFGEAREKKAFLVIDEIDSFLIDRSKQSVNTEAISGIVNEMLVQMEAHQLPFAGTTNHLDKLDPAARRRFLFKLEFQYLTAAQLEYAFQFFFRCPAPVSLKKLGGLTVSDFALVKRKAGLLEAQPNPDYLVSLLREESVSKTGSKIITFDDLSADFDFSLSNPDQDLSTFCAQISNPKASPNFSILAYGPPGTGKSLFLRYLAGKLGREVIQKRSSELMSPWVGESEQNIAKAFKEGTDRRAMLIVDEIEGMIGSREFMDRDFEIRKTNEMLTWIEIYAFPFAATTNYLEKIDAAAIRRFLFKVKFDYMNEQNIAYAFEKFFKAKAPSAILELKCLVPSDFAAVKKKINVFGIDDLNEIAHFLEQEVEAKGIHPEQRRVGF